MIGKNAQLNTLPRGLLIASPHSTEGIESAAKTAEAPSKATTAVSTLLLLLRPVKQTRAPAIVADH